MVSIKLIVIVILATLLAGEFAEAGSKKQQRHNVKHKKSNNNGKLKATYKQAPAQAKTSQRNAKMNFNNYHSWPSTNSFYRPASTTPLFLRSSTPSMFYPMHWGNSYFNTPSLISPSSNIFRRSDDFSSTPTISSAQAPTMTGTQTPMMSMSSSQTPMMSLGNSQTPTIIDMSAFTGSGLMDNPFTSSSQNMWSMGDIPSPKPKFNFFNSFNLNDDGLFGNLFNQFG